MIPMLNIAKFVAKNLKIFKMVIDHVSYAFDGHKLINDISISMDNGFLFIDSSDYLTNIFYELINNLRTPTLGYIRNTSHTSYLLDYVSTFDQSINIDDSLIKFPLCSSSKVIQLLNSISFDLSVLKKKKSQLTKVECLILNICIVCAKHDVILFSNLDEYLKQDIQYVLNKIKSLALDHVFILNNKYNFNDFENYRILTLK